jgi:hypothetical protein
MDSSGEATAEPPSQSALAEVLGSENSRRLAALSVTTAEALLGMIAADPEATATFLGESDLSQVQAKLGKAAGRKAMATLAEVGTRTFALGATPPTYVEVEGRADPEVFERKVLPAAEGPPPPVGEGEGANITGCMGEVRNQEGRGTCVAFTVAALAECLLFRATERRLDLSEQFLYWNCKSNDGASEEEGTFIETATGLTVSDGVCLEKFWPYNPEKIPGNEGQGPPPQEALDDAGNQRLSKRIELANNSPQAVRETLDKGNPVALSVPVYQNWNGNPAFNSNGEIPMPLPLSELAGGHAMCAVGYGYDAAFAGGGFIILRNSWGTDFAPESRIAPGHALLPFLYFELYGWECFTAAA